jgi:periplasmic protein TonB
MRKYTLVFSVIAHAAAIAAVIIVPALATDELPEPRRASAFIVVNGEMPRPPVVPIQRAAVKPSPSPIPFEPPDGVQPERPVDPTPPGVDDVPLTTGVSFGDPIGPIDPDPPPLPPLPPRPKDPVRVGSVIQAPNKLVHVSPVYPRLALDAHKEGLVILEAVIAEDGRVRDVKVLRSQPLLDQAAIDAVRQWRFTPTLLHGEPVPVVMTVTVNFTIDK